VIKFSIATKVRSVVSSTEFENYSAKVLGTEEEEDMGRILAYAFVDQKPGEEQTIQNCYVVVIYAGGTYLRKVGDLKTNVFLFSKESYFKE